MKKFGFIGANDNAHILLYLAKILTALNHRVLIIDSTAPQKIKYIVPTISPTRTYVTNYENIDIAIGFDAMSEIKGYLGKTFDQNLEHDIILINIDEFATFENFGMEEAENNFFVTKFDLYSLKKGLEILAGVNTPILLTKILVSRKILKQNEDYLNFLSEKTQIVWNENVIHLIDNGYDKDIIEENEKVAKLKFKNLSPNYKEALATLLITMLPGYKINDVIKLLKSIDKGV